MGEDSINLLIIIENKGYIIMPKTLKSLFGNHKPKVLGVIGILFIGLCIYLYTHKEPQGLKTKVVLVKIEPVIEKQIDVVLKAMGNVVPKETVAVKSRLDSQIESIHFKEGDYVEENQLLIVLDDTALKAQLRQAEANLIRDKAVMDNLERQYQRIKIVAEKGFESKMDLDAAKYAWDAQKAAVAASQANIDNIKAQFEYTRILAQISGRTGSLGITVGNDVKANDTTSIVTINKIKPIYIQFSLPENRLLEFKNAMDKSLVYAIIIPDQAGANPVKAMIDHIGNAIDKSTGSFAVRAIYENENEELWPGMFTNVEVHIQRSELSIIVPEAAIQRTQDETFIFKVIDKKAVKTVVKINRMQEGVAIIEEGLKSGDLVITDGILNLEDGAAIEVSNASTGEIKP